MPHSPHSDTITAGIRIRAAAHLRSRPGPGAAGVHEYEYQITMSNEGDLSARLLARHWIILDSENRREDVRGRGVIGEFPKLMPGESYTYQSRCPLRTPWGTMEGSYLFERDSGATVEVRIGRFFLVPSAPPLPLEQRSR